MLVTITLADEQPHERVVPRFEVTTIQPRYVDGVLYDQMLTIEGELPSGQKIQFGLNSVESAKLYLIMHKDTTIREWAESIDFWDGEGGGICDLREQWRQLNSEVIHLLQPVR
jgi:hypothetical protein